MDKNRLELLYSDTLEDEIFDAIVEREDDFIFEDVIDDFGIDGVMTDVPEEMLKDVAKAQRKLAEAYVKILRHLYEKEEEQR